MSIELHAGARRTILRQHRELRLVLAATIEAAGAARGGSQQLPSLVALGLKLSRMIGRHSAFEEAALRPHLTPGGADVAHIEALASRQRKQLMELSLLTKLALDSRGVGRLLPAFRGLSQNILKHINKQERALFRKRWVAKPVARSNGPQRAVTPEASKDAVAAAGNPAPA